MIIKFGIDPTGTSIHLGRTIPLLKLRDLQNEGHQIVIIMGTFTAVIGDPSDKLGKRPEISEEQVWKNMETLLPLLWKILDKDKTQVVDNALWLKALPSQKILQMMSRFSVQQMTARRNFSKRMKEKEPIYMHELMYPILQGYDSYYIKSDVEVGGEDQIFNMNVGRDIQEMFGMKPQEVITTPLLPGTDGEKMSTTAGNVINIDEEPQVMFDKIMSIRDEVASLYGEHCIVSDKEFSICSQHQEKDADCHTCWPFRFHKGDDIREYKVKIANTITRMYHPEWEFLNPSFKSKK